MVNWKLLNFITTWTWEIRISLCCKVIVIRFHRGFEKDVKEIVIKEYILETNQKINHYSVISQT